MSATMEKAAAKILESLEREAAAAVMAKAEQQRKIDKVFRQLLHDVPTLEDDRFWELLERLKKKVSYTKTKRGEMILDKVERASENFAWEFAYGKLEDDFYELLSFVNTYNEKVGELYKPLFDVIEGYGDDGYGDLLDSFPLKGREAYEKALQGVIDGSSSEQYQGENYVRMRLEDAAKKYFESRLHNYEEDED